MGLLLRSWSIVCIGNLIGASGLAIVFGLSGLPDGPVGITPTRVIGAKAALQPVEAFVRGALCNALVCLAVWLSFAARSVADKVLAILWSISAFIFFGLEHSFANMFFSSGLYRGVWRQSD